MLILGIILFGMIVGAGAQLILGRSHGSVDWTMAIVDLDVPLRRLARVYLANRGVWDAIVGAGPTCCVAATDEDVDAYLAAFTGLVG